MSDISSIPYVVLVSDVGVGKSTVVEKLTGEKGRSSAASRSFTKQTEYFWSVDRSMVLSDTPGSNPLQEKLEHNVEIAGALNLAKVSKIIVIVKANTRIENVVESVQKYAEKFAVELGVEVIGVLVTHMDEVTWGEPELKAAVADSLGIETILTCSLGTRPELLLKSLRAVCSREKFDIKVDSENFLKLFAINDGNLKIIKCTRDEVNRIKKMKEQFEQARRGFTGKDLVDLYFEFQAWITYEIEEAKKSAAEKLKFTFYGDKAANEAGHLANMVNQMRLVLADVRTETLKAQADVGVDKPRQCPHCSLVWSKIEGCTGKTECGARPSSYHDVRSPDYGVMGTFAFAFNNGKLSITKSGERSLQQRERSKQNYGCGKSIVWDEMRPVDLPSDFVQVVSTADIDVLPQGEGPRSFKNKLEGMLGAAGERLKRK